MTDKPGGKPCNALIIVKVDGDRMEVPTFCPKGHYLAGDEEEGIRTYIKSEEL